MWLSSRDEVSDLKYKPIYILAQNSSRPSLCRTWKPLKWNCSDKATEERLESVIRELGIGQIKVKWNESKGSSAVYFRIKDSQWLWRGEGCTVAGAPENSSSALCQSHPNINYGELFIPLSVLPFRSQIPWHESERISSLAKSCPLYVYLKA